MYKTVSRILTVTIISSFFQACTNGKSREDYKRTHKVCDFLYTETFSTFSQGAFGGDRNAKWLTDSTNFRIFIGEFDEVNGRIVVECKNDTVLVTQFPDDLNVNQHLKEPVTTSYLLKDLRKLNNLNDF